MKVTNNSRMAKTLKLGSLLLCFTLLPAARLMADSTLSTIVVGAQSPRPIAAGAAASYTVTVTRVGNGNFQPVLSASGLPVGATATFSQNPLGFSGSVTSLVTTMVIATEASVSPGIYNFDVSVSGGSVRNTQTAPASLE